ncbi:MAG: cupin domain-containing protein [Rhodospirillales bacterium]|nr:cupin domain-containing protein [Rhodospirillales bacterium]
MTPLRSGNLFAGLPVRTEAVSPDTAAPTGAAPTGAAPTGTEHCEPVATRDGVRIERIVSTGQTTPEGDWYDQDWDEWVLLVSGGAALLLEDEAAPRRLQPGDWLLIPAGRRHRVTWTDPLHPTVWLCVHWPASELRAEER